MQSCCNRKWSCDAIAAPFNKSALIDLTNQKTYVSTPFKKQVGLIK